jgi:hypothetical protein
MQYFKQTSHTALLTDSNLGISQQFNVIRLQQIYGASVSMQYFKQISDTALLTYSNSGISQQCAVISLQQV